MTWLINRPTKTTRVTSPFGWRSLNGKQDYHQGTDYAPITKVGEDIYAVADGKVILAQYSSTAGNWVQIKHANGYISIYMHMRSGLRVKTGDQVRAGQVIGRMGNTGASFGEHLHFGLVNPKGIKIDPEKEMSKIGTSAKPPASLPPVSASKPASNPATKQRTYPKPKKGYVGLTDALESINVDSSYEHRSRIAAANGIKAYTGASAQNRKMQDLLYLGKLMRA